MTVTVREVNVENGKLMKVLQRAAELVEKELGCNMAGIIVLVPEGAAALILHPNIQAHATHVDVICREIVLAANAYQKVNGTAPRA